MVYTRPIEPAPLCRLSIRAIGEGSARLKSCCWDEQSNGRKGRPTGRPFVHCNSPRAIVAKLQGRSTVG